MKSKTKIPKNKNCQSCPAICCNNLAVGILKPVTKEEVGDLLWQLHFDTVKVYIRKRRWYQWIQGKCIYLTRGNRCSIYERRPDKCRNHNPPDCELFGKFYDVMFSTPKELEDYLAKELTRRKRKKLKK